MTFPAADVWDVPAGGWHIDFPARSALRLKWLGYLEPVAVGGGGTVVLEGSHRLVANLLPDLDPADPGRSPADHRLTARRQGHRCAAVASSVGKKLSRRISCAAMSCGVPTVVTMEK